MLDLGLGGAVDVALLGSNSEKATIGGEDLRAETSAIEARHGVSAGVFGEMKTKRWGVDQLLDSPGKCQDVSGRETDGIVIGREKLAGAAGFRDDHRLAARHGFDNRPAKRLRLRAGMNDHIERSIDIRGILLEADQSQMIR